MNMNKIKVGAKIKVNAENPTTAHTLARSSHGIYISTAPSSPTVHVV